MKKYLFEASLAIGLAVSLVIGALALEAHEDISEKLVRLHVIANSDSAEDQALKLRVRDEILEYVSDLTKSCENIDEAKHVISKNLSELERIADSVISENGFGYTSRAELSNVYFPTRVYDSFSLPAGNYDALRIHLGTGQGKNWWCVLFPPLCVSAAEVEAELSDAGVSCEDIKLITSDEPQYRFKFKIVEIIENVFKKR
ncbi:MAG: stage II sporulation protein R [Oscillospiraceae bacterium]|nr:stage II sporulation protein R [Oscillospiraceae bacterium]MBQ6901660.1 stage II sporulation protein R [Oscillospiraceae bacterium]